MQPSYRKPDKYVKPSSYNIFSILRDAQQVMHDADWMTGSDKVQQAAKNKDLPICPIPAIDPRPYEDLKTQGDELNHLLSLQQQYPYGSNAQGIVPPILERDAFRHIYASAIFHHYLSDPLATIGTDSHEYFPAPFQSDLTNNRTWASHNMDFTNNDYGKKLADYINQNRIDIDKLPDMVYQAVKGNQPVPGKIIINPWAGAYGNEHDRYIHPNMAPFIKDNPYDPPKPLLQGHVDYLQDMENHGLNNWAVAGLANGVPAQGVKNPEPPRPASSSPSVQTQMSPTYQQSPSSQQPTQSKPERLVPFTGLQATTWQPWYNLSTMDPGHPLYPITKKYIPFYDSLSQNKTPATNPEGISGQEETVSSPKPPLPMGGTFAPVYDPTKRGDCHGFPHSETPTGPVMH